MNKEQAILEKVKQDPAAHIIWVDAAAKIASFRAVENYSLSMDSGASADALVEITAQIFSPAQGDVG